MMSDKNNYAIILPGGSGARLWPLSRTMRPKQLQHRSEYWVVVSGLATITNNGNTYTLEENQSTYIPKTHRHRLSNETDQILVMIEVQCGDYVGENDIVRFDDYYGRTSND